MIRALALAVVLLAGQASPAPAQDRPLAIVGGTVIDGTGAPPRDGLVIVVRGGRIEAIGPAGSTPIPEGAAEIDARGYWIVPGLIDAHVHLFQSGGIYTRPDILDLRHERPYGVEIAAIRERLPATFARFLGSGITGVLDLGGPTWTIEARRMAEAAVVAPRIAAAGPLLATFAPPELAAGDPPIIAVDSPDAARAALRRLIPLRPDIVKIWFVRPPQDLEPGMAWVRLVIAEAHAAGIRVAAHATQRRVAEAMVDAGVDLLAHSVEDEPIPDAMLRKMADQGTVYVPTLAVREGYRRILGGRPHLTPAERRWGDATTIAGWQRLAERPDYRPPRWAAAPFPVPDPTMAENLRRAVAAGVRVAAGSDAGNVGTLPGPGLHRELALMVAAGLTPMETLMAATAGGAAAMGLTDRAGTLAVGKSADMLILWADPLAGIGNLQAILRIIKGGRVFDPETIEAALPPAR